MENSNTYYHNYNAWSQMFNSYYPSGTFTPNINQQQQTYQYPYNNIFYSNPTYPNYQFQQNYIPNSNELHSTTSTQYHHNKNTSNISNKYQYPHTKQYIKKPPKTNNQQKNIKNIKSDKKRNFHQDDLFVPKQIRELAYRKLQTTEEIEKYIQERKKNYPTKTNIKRKLEEQKIKQEVGVMADTPINISISKDNEYENSEIESNISSSNSINQSSQNRKICKYYLKGKCQRGLHCKYLHDLNTLQSYNETATSKLFIPPPSNNLIDKLFSSETIEYQNMLLQIFRFLVNNQFRDDRSSIDPVQ